MKNENNERPIDGLVLRDLYEQYWRCRDFEITNLWQRSIFLGAFLILCFTGYGAFCGKAFFNDNNNFCFFEDGFWKCHLVAMCLTILGVLFSWLWICLAKASKAWVEVYERAICAIEKRMGGTLETYTGFQYNKILFYPKGNGGWFDESIFSTSGGMYSPSRINILIGIVSLCVMVLFSYIHFLLGVYLKLVDIMIPYVKECRAFFVVLLCFIVLVISLGIVCLIIWLVFFNMSEHISSQTLKDKDPGETWVDDVALLEKFYPKQIAFLSEIRKKLNQTDFINGKNSEYAYENGCVYLIYHFVYKNEKRKIDISVTSSESPKVVLELKDESSKKIFSKKNIKVMNDKKKNGLLNSLEMYFCKMYKKIWQDWRSQVLVNEDCLIDDVVAELQIWDKNRKSKIVSTNDKLSK